MKRHQRRHRLTFRALLGAGTLLACAPATALAAPHWSVALTGIDPGKPVTSATAVSTAMSCRAAGTPLFDGWSQPSDDSWIPDGYPNHPVRAIGGKEFFTFESLKTPQFAIVDPPYGGTYVAPRLSVCLPTMTANTVEDRLAGTNIVNVHVIGNPDPIWTKFTLQQLSQIPDAVRRRFDSKGGYAAIIRGPITRLQGYEMLTGHICDDGDSARPCSSIRGLGVGPYSRPGFVVRTNSPLPNDTPRVAMHELGHAVDQVYESPSSTRAWTRGPWAETRGTCWDNAYERDHANEWFATSFDLRYQSQADSRWLHEHCPRTWTYLTQHFGNGTFVPRTCLLPGGQAATKIMSLTARMLDDTQLRMSATLLNVPKATHTTWTVDRQVAGSWGKVAVANSSLDAMTTRARHEFGGIRNPDGLRACLRLSVRGVSGGKQCVTLNEQGTGSFKDPTAAVCDPRTSRRTSRNL